MKTNSDYSSKLHGFTAAALAAFLCIGTACAVPATTTIVSDTFAGDNGTAVDRTPDLANLPGGAWAKQNNGAALIADNQLALESGDTSVAIALASSGEYARPAFLTISADLKVDGLVEDGQWPDCPRGMKLGFASENPGNWDRFTGLTLHPDGSLDYAQDGRGVVRVAWSGAPFVPGNYYNLSYTIDTANNKIGSIQLAGSTADYSLLVDAAAGNITMARTTYAAIRVSCTAGNTGHADNFEVTTPYTTPPPPVVALRPLDNAKYTLGAPVIAAVSFVYGTAPFTVNYYIRPVGGEYPEVPVTSTTAPLYQVDLGSQSLGSYEVYAKVTDANNLVGESTHTITVQAATPNLLSVNYTAASGSTAFTGMACVGTSGDYWNSPSVTVGTRNSGDFGLAPVQLKDSKGAFTPAFYSATLPGGEPRLWFPVDPNANALYNSTITTLDNQGAMTHTITGLAAGDYDVYAYGDWNGGVSVNGGAVQSWTDTGWAAFYTAFGVPAFTIVGATSPSGQYWGPNAVKFAAVTVADGVPLTINQAGSGGTRFSGIQIRAVSGITYTLTYTAEANGSITGTSPQTEVPYGTSGTPVTATPDPGYYFVKWSDDSTTNQRMDTNVSGDINVSASFAINYASWAAANGIAGQAANGDADSDGVSNAAEMVLGGLPSTRMDAGLIPTLALVTNPSGMPAGNYLEFTYRRSSISLEANIATACQYNTNLGALWTTAVDGTDGVKVITTPNHYALGIDRIQVYVPCGANTKLFGRLDVTVPTVP
jgi:hypothetical protein